jgi:hypothetical protein
MNKDTLKTLLALMIFLVIIVLTVWGLFLRFNLSCAELKQNWLTREGYAPLRCIK